VGGTKQEKRKKKKKKKSCENGVSGGKSEYRKDVSEEQSPASNFRGEGVKLLLAGREEA